jgi:hypothetical protein
MQRTLLAATLVATSFVSMPVFASSGDAALSGFTRNALASQLRPYLSTPFGGAEGAPAASTLFDSISLTPATATGFVPVGAAPSPGNTFMNAPVSQTIAGINSITGFDAIMVNSGAQITVSDLRLNAFIFTRFGTGTAATDLAYDPTSLISGGPIVFDFDITAPFPFATNSFIDFGPADIGLANPSTPGFDFGGAVPIDPNDDVIGITLNWQVVTPTSGGNFVNIAGLTTGVRGGTTAPPFAVGDTAFGGPIEGYFRNASLLTTGNLRNNDARNIGNFSSLTIRVYGTEVPEPTTLAGLAAVAVVSLRRRRA